jgi:hypothetical protein
MQARSRKPRPVFSRKIVGCETVLDRRRSPGGIYEFVGCVRHERRDPPHIIRNGRRWCREAIRESLWGKYAYQGLRDAFAKPCPGFGRMHASGGGCGIRAPQADSSSRTQDAEHVNGPQNERDPPACIDDMGLGPQGLLAP